jgi:archaetidylinositol phosphate synthase
MNKQEFNQSWSKLHGNAQITGVVKGWLGISYILVKPLAKLRVTPNLLTILGLFFGILLYLNALSIWAILFLVLSLICDGIDGSLAIITGKNGKWGAMLDSVVDRITELFWALTFISIGADQKLVIAAVLIAATQEYLRARSAGLGLTDLGVVTIAERPVRASILFVALVAFTLNLEFINLLALLWLIMQAISLLTLTKFSYKKLN